MAEYRETFKMTTENKIKYASKLNEGLFNLIKKLNYYIDISKLNKGLVAYRFSTKRNTERKVAKLLKEKKELEKKIKTLLYGEEPRRLTCLRNRKRNAIRLVKIEGENNKKAI